MINRLQFSIDIKAIKTKIWESLWSDNLYREWASVFFEGSYAVTNNWKVGSKVLFLAPDKSDIYSSIETHFPNKVITFKHLGNVVKGIEQPIDEETKKWSGATETYSLTKGIEYDQLIVEIDILDEHLDFMKNTLPTALKK